MRMKRGVCLFLAVLIAVCCFSGCEKHVAEDKIFNTFEDFGEARLGVLSGTDLEAQTKELFPESKKLGMNTVTDLLLSLEMDKIDGFLLEDIFFLAVGWEKKGFRSIKTDKTTPVEFGFLMADNDKGNKLKKEFNEFVAKASADGFIDRLAKKWHSGKKPAKAIDYTGVSGTSNVISVAVLPADKPMSFLDNGAPSGFDVELVIAFAEKYGYNIDFNEIEFDALLSGISTEKYDVGLGGIIITEERKEELNYSDPYFQSPVSMVVLDSSDEWTRISDYRNKRIGVVTGNVAAVFTPTILPDADFMEFNSTADAKMALENGKIDAFPADESVYNAMCRDGLRVERVDEPLMRSNYGFILGKGENIALRNELNEYIAKSKADGTFEALEKKWFGQTEPADIYDYKDLTAARGEIRVGVCSSTKPFVYMKDGNYTGFDVEVLIGFCKEYGYGIRFEDTFFAGVLTGVVAGTYDIGASGLTITDERKESVDFSDAYYTEDMVFVINREEDFSDIENLTAESFSHSRIGVLQGSYTATFIDEIYPDAQIIEFNNISDSILALEQGKIDVLPNDESVYFCMKWENKNFRKAGEKLETSDYGMVLPKGRNQKLKQQLNSFIIEQRENGQLARLDEKWFGEKEPTEFEEYRNLDGTNGVIRVGLYTEGKPFVYVKEDMVVGFEVDLLTMFAREYGYTLDFEGVAFSSILAGITTGKYDVGISGFTISDERKETVDFTEIHHKEDVILIVKGPDENGSLEQFENAALGVVTGSLYGGYTKELFPNADIREFNNFADVLMALKQSKVDGIMLDRPNYNSVARTDKSLECIKVDKYSVELGFGFQKNEGGKALQAQMNKLLDRLDAEGRTEAMIDKWYGETEPEETIPLEELSENEKTINVAIDTTRKPFVYMYDSQPVGFEIEMLYLFCKEYGYNARISDVSFASGLAGLSGEKYDLVCGGLYMTDERKESVNFSDSYMVADVVMARYERSEFNNFLTSIGESFEKTFIRESRWKLILEGICTTLVISLFAVLGGTLLGFAVYMLTRSRKKWLSKPARGFAKAHSTIVAGTPALVVLMILFYVVFTSPDMSGVLVAIFGFIFTFGSFVYENLLLAVSGVDVGQMEAAYALGYSRNRTFFRIVLPQAMKMFIPVYSSEIVNLIKGTSIVGYIAVNDLTKMGDIIRGNTYEAFFPLIAVAVIYFIITRIITSLLGILKKKTEPKKRKDKNILKGVVR